MVRPTFSHVPESLDAFFSTGLFHRSTILWPCSIYNENCIQTHSKMHVTIFDRDRGKKQHWLGTPNTDNDFFSYKLAYTNTVGFTVQFSSTFNKSYLFRQRSSSAAHTHWMHKNKFQRAVPLVLVILSAARNWRQRASHGNAGSLSTHKQHTWKRYCYGRLLFPLSRPRKIWANEKFL